MNKRQESKLKTRQLILDTAGNLIREKGIMALPTTEIATQCGISHGSLFQHFGTREALIQEVLEEEIKKSARSLRDALEQGSDSLELLRLYLDVLEKDPVFFQHLYRELPFFPESVRNHVVSLEVLVRNSFFRVLHDSTPALSEANITLGLDAFFALLHRFFALSELYSSEKNVITVKRADLCTLFQALFLKGGF